MKQGLLGDPLSPTMVGHFDACLGCMACVTACPSGVQYNRLIEQTRAQVERRHQRTRAERALRGAIFALFPHPKRLRALRGPLRAYQKFGVDRLVRRSGLLERLAPSLAAMEALAPSLSKPERVLPRVSAQGPRRAVVGMLTGCVQREFFPAVNAATARGTEPLRVGEQCEDRTAQRTLGASALVPSFDLGSGLFDRPVVLHPGGAGGHTCHAAQTGIEVPHHGGAE